MLWPQNFKKYNLLCWDDEDFCLEGEGGLVICRWGELGLGKRRRNRRGEGRYKRHILTFSDRLTDWNIPSAILTEKSTRHPYGSAFQIPWWFHWYFQRWIGHVTRTDLPFKSLGDSVNIFDGELVTSLYGSSILNPSVILSEKITRQNRHVSDPPFFFLNSELFVYNSVVLSVIIDRITDVKSFVGNFDLKLPKEIVCRWFRCY